MCVNIILFVNNDLTYLLTVFYNNYLFVSSDAADKFVDESYKTFTFITCDVDDVSDVERLATGKSNLSETFNKSIKVVS